MANRREKEVAEKYEEEGWKPIRGGWPDWLMVKVNDKEIIDTKVVEVKNPNGKLRYNQKIVRDILEKHDMEYAVEVVE